jgi:hypothetical protein
VVRQSCCSQSVSSVLEFVFYLDFPLYTCIIDHFLCSILTCSKFYLSRNFHIITILLHKLGSVCSSVKLYKEAWCYTIQIIGLWNKLHLHWCSRHEVKWSRWLLLWFMSDLSTSLQEVHNELYHLSYTFHCITKWDVQNVWRYVHFIKMCIYTNSLLLHRILCFMWN